MKMRGKNCGILYTTVAAKKLSYFYRPVKPFGLGRVVSKFQVKFRHNGL